MYKKYPISNLKMSPCLTDSSTLGVKKTSYFFTSRQRILKLLRQTSLLVESYCESKGTVYRCAPWLLDQSSLL